MECNAAKAVLTVADVLVMSRMTPSPPGAEKGPWGVVFFVAMGGRLQPCHIPSKKGANEQLNEFYPVQKSTWEDYAGETFGLGP